VPVSGIYQYYLQAVDADGTTSGYFTIPSIYYTGPAGQQFISVTVTVPVALTAPTNLTATSPAQNPVLNWTASDGSPDFYNIYRNGNLVDTISANNTSYTDSLAPEGNNAYYVTALKAGTESAPSGTVSSLVDRTGPTITPTVIPGPNAAGWNNTPVTVSYACDDGAGSGVQTCASPQSESTDGVYSLQGTATDNAGNASTVNTTVKLDQTAPTVGAPTWTANPLLQGQNTTLSIPATDDLSGLASVQYSLDGGTPQAMTYNAATNTWQATFGASLAASTYNLTVTATDNAGNASTAFDVLAVYSATNGYVTGHAKTLPTASDTMPIALDTSNNPTKLVLGFTNVMSPASGSFDAGYVVKNNQDEFSLSSTSITWAVVQDSTHASILGRADLTTYVNGVKTITQNVSVRFDIVLGSGTVPDHVTVKIYNPSDNPNTAAPIYAISDNVLANGSNLMIHP